MPEAKIQRMSSKDFTRVASETEMEAQAKKLAFEFLVKGKSGPEIAELYGTSKQRVDLAVRSIRKARHRIDGPLDSVWVRMEEDLPEDLAPPLTLFINALQRCKNEVVRHQAIANLAQAINRATVALE